MAVVTRHQRPLYDVTAIDDTAQDLFSGVEYIVYCSYVIREITGGSVEAGMASTSPGSSVEIYDDGTDVVELLVSAGGDVTVQRTAGADTFDARMEFIWL